MEKPLADETDPAIPAATVVLVRDGASGPRDADAQAGLPSRLRRRRLGVPRRPHRRGGLPRGRRGPPTAPTPTPRRCWRRPAPPRCAKRSRRRASRSTATALVWFAHWTPAHASPRRFATWFFLAPAPDGTVVIDDGEIREHEWIRPRDAVARRDAGEVELVPPTYVTLHELAAYDKRRRRDRGPRLRHAAVLRHPDRSGRRWSRVALAGRRRLRHARPRRARAPEPAPHARHRLGARTQLTRSGLPTRFAPRGALTCSPTPATACARPRAHHTRGSLVPRSAPRRNPKRNPGAPSPATRAPRRAVLRRPW